MALGEAARFRPPAEPSTGTVPVVIVAELLGWIEEQTLRGPATLYMERRAGVNDTGARRLRVRKLQIQARRLHGPGPHREEADRVACDGSPPGPLATVHHDVWCRATQGEDMMETGSEGAKFVIDEPGLRSGSPGCNLPICTPSFLQSAEACHERGRIHSYSTDGWLGQIRRPFALGEAVLPAPLLRPLDGALRCMRAGEHAELAASGWQLSRHLLEVSRGP
jgi:hypothetical protein